MRESVFPGHEDVVVELRALKAQQNGSNGPVFGDLMPEMDVFKADLATAQIPFVNEKGQRADFHSLRHTLATNLALAGTAPRVAMEVMRHSDMRLTAQVYTDSGLLPIADAVSKLPSLRTPLEKDSQIDSQNLFRASPDVSTPVTDFAGKTPAQVPTKKEVRIFLSSAVTTGPKKEKSGSCRTRTYNQVLKRRLLYH